MHVFKIISRECREPSALRANGLTQAQRTRRVTGRQSNHGSYTLPPSVSHLRDVPLYVAAAYWGLVKAAPFSRDELALAFRITPRQAGDVMSYIQAARRDHISSVRHITKPGRGMRMLRLEITAVSDKLLDNPKRRTPPPRPSRAGGQKKTSGIREMRTWFLTKLRLSPTD